MNMFRPLHPGLAYGEGAIDTDSWLPGQLVKNGGDDMFSLNTGGGAHLVPSFGILGIIPCVGLPAPGLPLVYCGPGIFETDYYDGSPVAGDGLYCSTNAKLTPGYDDANEAVKAVLNTGSAGTNKIVWTAVDGGTIGNGITVKLYVNGTSTALSVAVSGLDITVNIATAAVTGAATSTVAAVLEAVAASGPATALVSATSADTGVVTTVAKTNLAGGVAKALQVGRCISCSGGILKFRFLGL